jgi:diadenosine tetraphosphate (Ap4A) HIT family hydrolase
LYVPKDNDNANWIVRAFEDALADGNAMVKEGRCDGFNIGLNSGEAAGQTVMYPHVHLIPRRIGDVEDPVGGVRNTIPGKGNYRK